jgi:hypothetical protein
MGLAVTVVNMIPQSLSGETNQDSEPSLAVNPSNFNQMAATAFTPNPSGGSFAPIFVSSNGGNTWALNPIVPGATASFPTGDITIRFGSTSNVLYGGILRADTFLELNVLRTSNYLSSTPMTVLESRGNEDQPWVEATTATGVSGTPDRVYVGNNDWNTAPKTATIDQSLNAAAAPPPAGFVPITIASRTPAGTPPNQGNLPSIRPTIHSSGRIYVAYFNPTANPFTANAKVDVVVCRDDNWGQGGSPYQVLKDTDGFAGIRVAKGVTIPWVSFVGQNRTGSHLSIAVDPSNADVVYLAWADSTPYTIRLRKSTDGGKTWSASDLRAIPNGMNPALAVNAKGVVGFLYQELINNAANWQTILEVSANGFATAPTSTVLANTPANTPLATFQPYLGDYIYLAAGPSSFIFPWTFYGVFCANNTPDNSHFPNGVKYQRNANFTTKQLLNVDNKTPVAVSIDPFFFAVSNSLIIPIFPIHPILPIQVVTPVKPIAPIHPVVPIEPIEPIEPVSPAPASKPKKPK